MAQQRRTVQWLVAGAVLLKSNWVTDYIEGQPVPDKKASYEPDRGTRPDKGWIGLQNHSDKDIVLSLIHI